jgi:uncharacterized membrane protein
MGTKKALGRRRRLTRRDAVAGVVLAVSVAVLGVQLLNPTPLVITVEGGSTEMEHAPNFFTYRDVAVVSSLLAGASTTYLLGPSSVPASEPTSEEAENVEEDEEVRNGDNDEGDVDLIEKRKQEWNEYADDLRNGEKEIYEVVLESDGVAQQSKIVEETDFSKSHVSRKLDVLESKQLVERKRRGMGNVVVLK